MVIAMEKGTPVESPKRMITKECAVCGVLFQRERKRGRPAVTCSAECKRRRGVHGGMRKDRASTGTGIVSLDWSTRVGGDSPASAVALDLLGDAESDSRGAVIALEPHRSKPGATWDRLREEWAAEGRTERLRAAREGWGDVADALPYGPADVGRTVPAIRRVIGSDEPWGWAQEWESRGFCPWTAPGDRA